MATISLLGGAVAVEFDPQMFLIHPSCTHYYSLLIIDHSHPASPNRICDELQFLLLRNRQRCKGALLLYIHMRTVFLRVDLFFDSEVLQRL